MAANLTDLTPEERSLLLNGLPLLSQTFWGPSGEWCKEIQHAGQTRELEKLGNLAGENGAARNMTSYVDNTINSNKLCEILEAAYVRLFISTKGGITASLHQSFYESKNGQLMGPSAQRMASRLKASGLAIPENGSVPPDHLALEVEYLTLLIERAFQDGGQNFISMVQDFARLELMPWLTEFSNKLEPETDCPFYPAAATLLLGLISLVSA